MMARDVLKSVENLMGIFEQRRAEKDIQREVKIRQAKASIRRHISNQRRMSDKLWELGKRALTLEDEAQFQRVGAQYLKTQEDVARWERYLLTFETMEARRDQATATASFLEALQEMNDSLMEVASPQAMARMQRDLAEGLARAETIEERMAVMMESTDEALAGEPVAAGERLDELQRMMGAEAENEEADAYDTRIQEGLHKIREEMQGR